LEIKRWKNMERNQLLAIVVVVVIVGATGVFILLAPPPVTLAEDQTIIYEGIALPEYMDPHKNYETAGSWIHYNIYETLFTYPWDSTNTDPSVGLLAVDYTLSSDGKTYTFNLREGITFHDGTEFNATAVQYNFWRMLGRGWDDGWGPVWMIAEPIKGGAAVEDAVYEFGDGSDEHIAAWENWQENSDAITVVSEFVVEVELAYAYTPFVSALTYEVGAMISPTYFMANGGMAPGGDTSVMDETACGTGPYELVTWVQDDRIELELFDDYWRAEDALLTHPYAGSITDVTIKLNPDVSSRILNLEAGTIDMMYWPVINSEDIYNDVVAPDPGTGTTQSLNPDIKVMAGNPTFDVMFLGFNMNPYINASGEIRLSPFTDINTREAISYAFDYEALINNILNGFGQQLQGPIPDGMFGHYDDLFMFEQDLAAAVTSWNLAMDNGLDDVLANNSHELNIYYNEGNDNRQAAGLLVKQAIEDIIADPASTNPSSEMTIDVYGLEWASYLYQVRNKQLPIFWLGWAPDYADPDNYAAPFVKSTGTFPSRVGLVGSTGTGGTVWDHALIDGLIDDAAVETNAVTRAGYYQTIQEAIVDHCAYLWGYQSTSFEVERADMNGYQFNPMHDRYFYHYYRTV
ncbi:MAG: ABC transporter substrate-binding protein, partial [Candidatus Thorarchaeota archaeon]